MSLYMGGTGMQVDEFLTGAGSWWSEGEGCVPCFPVEELVSYRCVSTFYELEAGLVERDAVFLEFVHEVVGPTFRARLERRMGQVRQFHCT